MGKKKEPIPELGTRLSGSPSCRAHLSRISAGAQGGSGAAQSLKNPLYFRTLAVRFATSLAWLDEGFGQPLASRREGVCIMDIEPIDGDPRWRARALAGFHEHRGWFIATGIALVVLGVLGIALPSIFTVAVDSLIGALLLVGGVVHGAHAFQVRRWTGALPRLLVAALYLIAGIIILVRPLTGALALTLTLSAFLLAIGVSRILLARDLRPLTGWGWTLASGILSVLLGGLLLFGWPMTALWAIGLYVGVDLLVAGWSMLGLALATRMPALR
jgi:uncharacterized membrane protein HdeD (DUF308 family)